MTELLALLVIGVLITANAAFAGTEFALLSLRTSQVRQLRQQGERGRTVAALVEDPNRYLAAVQIGVTLAGFLASAVAAVVFTEPLAGHLEPLGRAARPGAVVLVTVALVFVTLVLSELVPKRLAMQRARDWSLLAARPLTVAASLAGPAIWLLSRTTDIVVRIVGGDPATRHEAVSDGELDELVAGHLAADEREIVVRSLGLADRRVSDLAVRRRDVVAFASVTPADDAIATLIDAGHSRAPVFDGELDEVIGTVHLRDLLRTRTVGEAAGPALLLSDDLDAVQALREMQNANHKLAVVTDPDRRVIGIVTTEDLVESVVGDIRDAEEARRTPDDDAPE